jgi:hypothetical protein
VAVVRVGEPGAVVQQALEAALGVQVAVLHHLLLRQAVHHQHHHQRGPSGLRRDREEEEKDYEDGAQKVHPSTIAR